MKITITDLKNLCKFSLASGNAVIPFISFMYLGDDNLVSLKSFSVFSGSLFMVFSCIIMNRLWQVKLLIRLLNGSKIK